MTQATGMVTSGGKCRIIDCCRLPQPKQWLPLSTRGLGPKCVIAYRAIPRTANTRATWAIHLGLFPKRLAHGNLITNQPTRHALNPEPGNGNESKRMWQMMRTNRLLAATIGLALVGGVFIMPCQPVSALSITVGATIKASKCYPANWRAQAHPNYNGLHTYKPTPNSGTIKACYFKYKLAASDPKGDYYFAETTIDVAHIKKENNFQYWNNPYKLQIASNLSAIDNVFNGSGNVTKTWYKATASLSFSLYGIGIGLSYTFADSDTLKRTALSKSGATWSGGVLQAMKHAEVGYSQKVKKNTVPRITFKTWFPTYSYKWTSFKCNIPRAGTLTCYKPTRVSPSTMGYYPVSWTA